MPKRKPGSIPKKNDKRTARKVQTDTLENSDSPEHSYGDLERLSGVLHALRAGESPKTIKSKFQLGRKGLVPAIQRAFRIGLADVAPAPRSYLYDDLRNTFNKTVFEVVTAKHEFDRIAATHLLKWLRDAYHKIPSGISQDELSSIQCPCLAVGGGKSVWGVSEQLVTVLRSEHYSEYQEWLKSTPLFVVNATAGGRPWEPHLEASHLACRFSHALGKRAGVYSVSTLCGAAEKELIEKAYKNAIMVVSGVGEVHDAYCIKALIETGILGRERLNGVVGEFLYHPFDASGSPVLSDISPPGGFDVKEPASESARTEPQSSPLLASLFRFASVRGRPAPNPFRPGWSRTVVAIVNCEGANLEGKARSLLCLLRHGFLTHVCIPLNLATLVNKMVVGATPS
jgi:hypothetical protein